MYVSLFLRFLSFCELVGGRAAFLIGILDEFLDVGITLLKVTKLFLKFFLSVGNILIEPVVRLLFNSATLSSGRGCPQCGHIESASSHSHFI